MKKVSTLLAIATLGVCVPERAQAEVEAIPVLRVALGPSIHFGPPVDNGIQFAADVTAGAALAVELTHDISFILNPEAGYAFDGIGAHAFNLTMGVGYGNAAIYVSYQPRLLAGRAGNDVLVGMRNGLAMHVVADMASIELGHQFEHFAGALHQSVNVMFGVNPAALAYVIRKLK